MSETPDDAFFSRMRDHLSDKFGWFGMEEDNTIESLRSSFEAAMNPPRPEEPTGLGAVVEAANGDRWTRVDATGEGKFVWVCEADDEVTPFRWDDFSAVSILSPGVEIEAQP